MLITVDAGRLWRAEQAGLLQPVASTMLDERVPASLRHPEGLWFGLSQRVRAIVYAKDRVDPAEITTYEDLADPEVAGADLHPLVDQRLQPVAGRLDDRGQRRRADRSLGQGLVANLARPPQGGDTDQIKAVAAGECDLAVVNHYYLVRLIKSDDAGGAGGRRAVGILFPNQDGRGAHANISGAGVVATAPNRDNAVSFLEYLTTAGSPGLLRPGQLRVPGRRGGQARPGARAVGRDQDRRRQRRQARREQPGGGQADGPLRLAMSAAAAVERPAGAPAARRGVLAQISSGRNPMMRIARQQLGARAWPAILFASSDGFAAVR